MRKYNSPEEEKQQEEQIEKVAKIILPILFFTLVIVYFMENSKGYED